MNKSTNCGGSAPPTCTDNAISDDFNDMPYWLDNLDPAPKTADQLPDSADVVIIGSGYTGLNAAIQTARAGRSTVIVESGQVGNGCSTRNGGQISTSVKPSAEKLRAKHGPERARAIRSEGEAALRWIEDFLVAENIDCDFKHSGRFHAAHTPWHYEKLARDTEQLCRTENLDAFVVPRHEQRTELGTDAYYGGVVYQQHASLHPAKYHHGLLATAIEAGVQIVSHCEATAINRIGSSEGNRFTVSTKKGLIQARDVMVATNGYTSALTPWLQRRIIPIGSYIIATDPQPLALIDELFPTHRVASDTCRIIYYYRASPDRTRILFGGRVSANETNPAISGPRLHTEMSRIFPQLSDTRISHSWTGTVAYSFDELAHTGKHDGIHYAMSYCGSGVSMASYLGMRAGQRIVGHAEGQTAFDNLPFPTRPLYTGKPWFLPSVVSWYQWRDRMECKRAERQQNDASTG